MRLLILNPNTTASMTREIAEGARRAAPAGVEIIGRNPANGPAAIEGPEDGEAAEPGVLAEIARGRDEGVDASVIACFDDTALAAAQALTNRPVIGIGQAAFHAAALLGARFSVVTTLAVSVPIIEANIRGYGFAARCARVRASGVPVLELHGAGEARVAAEIAAALREDAPSAIVLGCGGMTDIAVRLQRDCPVPLIDGVRAAVLLACALVQVRPA